MNYKNKLYDVENLITRRIIGKTSYYLIKWKGYPITDSSWEPISHLYNIIDMVNEFNANFPYSIEQESLSKFYSKLKKNKNQKLKKKKKKKKDNNKKLPENKIIIPLDYIDLDNTINNEEKKEVEDNETTSDNKKIENIFNEENEQKLKNDITNESNHNKLIWPTIIW